MSTQESDNPNEDCLENRSKNELNATWDQIRDADQTYPSWWQQLWWNMRKVPLEKRVAKKHLNTTVAADWLKQGEDAQTRQQYAEAMRCVAQARDALRQAQMSESMLGQFWAIVAVVFQVIYLWLGITSLFTVWQQCYQEVTTVDSSVCITDILSLFESGWSQLDRTVAGFSAWPAFIPLPAQIHAAAAETVFRP